MDSKIIIENIVSALQIAIFFEDWEMVDIYKEALKEVNVV
jgi:hypothetical protein